jgi:hypothetical protein
LLAGPLLAAAVDPTFAATFVVTSSADVGGGTLRGAIEVANQQPGLDRIHFAIVSGPQVIQPTAPLPTVTDTVIIDGTTQPGFAGSPLIVINGALAGASANGLHISAASCEVQAVVVNGFDGHGIVIEGFGDTFVDGCFIGTNAAGSAAVANGGDGIQIKDSVGNMIGRIVAFGARSNLISGNDVGVRILGDSYDNRVYSNFIGTDEAGLQAIGNSLAGVVVESGLNDIGDNTSFPTWRSNVISGNAGDGVLVLPSLQSRVRGNLIGIGADLQTPVPNGSDGVELRGIVVGALIQANLILANGECGLLMSDGAVDNQITSNRLGTAEVDGLGNGLDGLAAVSVGRNEIGPSNGAGGNGRHGMRISDSAELFIHDNFLGDADSGPNAGSGILLENGTNHTRVDRNYITSNLGNGVEIRGPTTTLNLLVGNTIGASPSGMDPRPNLGHGVVIADGASHNPIQGGVIRFNAGAGVFLESGDQNQIGALISDNGGLGIDLAPLGVTDNDPLDADEGPNHLQNFPMLVSVGVGGGLTTITGTLHSTPSTMHSISFFANGQCDSSGHGEGAMHLGGLTVFTDGSGNAQFASQQPIALGPAITATASGLGDHTSEFSPCIHTPLPVVSQIQPTSGPSTKLSNVGVFGNSFQVGATSRFGMTDALDTEVLDPTLLLAQVPGLPPGELYDVTVRNPDGQTGVLTEGWFSDFLDVPRGHPFHAFVETIVREKVTVGCGSGYYCVEAPVRRDELAVFLLIANNGSNYAPPPPTGTVFLDVPATAFAAAFIEALAGAGVTAGCGGGNYCPADPVTREQVAVFLLRTLEGPTYVPPPCTSPTFSDVPCSSGFAPWIEELVTRGITAGCGGGLYCPLLEVTRGQMAVFLTVTFGLGL